MEIFFVWALLAAGVGFLADSRGRSGFGFFLLSVVLSPLLGLIVVLVMSNKKEEESKALSRSRDEEAKERERKREHEHQLESIRAIAGTGAASAKGAPVKVDGPLSVADELLKLATLRDKGVLSEAEFLAQKAAILRSGG